MSTGSINICRLIKEKLDEKGLPVAWLARHTGRKEDSLRKTLNHNRDIYINRLFHISVALKEDFFACYSERLKKIAPFYCNKSHTEMETETEGINICQLIKERLDEQNLPVAWLARQIGCDKDNLRKILTKNRNIYTDLLFNISVTLEEDFYAYYSEKLRKTLNG